MTQEREIKIRQCLNTPIPINVSGMLIKRVREDFTRHKPIVRPWPEGENETVRSPIDGSPAIQAIAMVLWQAPSI